MKKLSILTITLLFGFQTQAQTPVQKFVEVGTILTITQPSAQKFKHIHFPKENFIIKRGGIANYKSVYGNRVLVTAIEKKSDGSQEVVLQRVDGRKFFNSHASVKADIDKALKTGELKLTNAE